ncbi:hypothetical protein D9758_013661 [Tetrapyrgos nigripes]|uniref:DDE Tnp4 domain-containing protein n=1 Tax=Tetrapyrgos nigripes TaxID=182062 RepID=A0A8H5FQJ1_9AGAR|nr:hypothetical protein D9758_013661 [Tetrapyrgos nigripes]
MDAGEALEDLYFSDSDSSESDSSSSDTDASWDTSSTSLSDLSEEEPTPVQKFVQRMTTLYSRRNLEPHKTIPKSQTLCILLDDYRHNRPELFCEYLHIDPYCFDNLVSVFNNNSNNPQMPVEEQLVITLYCFGHYGNTASYNKVALLFGVGHGTVPLCTSRVLKAVNSERFQNVSVQWPNKQQWVQDNSCESWCDGWLIVDGTLIPLYHRPSYFGNVYYDRKSNYSVNVQLVSTPNLDIINYSVGLPGSQHNATAWKETHTHRDHLMILPLVKVADTLK